MGTKRKASQASLPVPQQEQQVRRSRRIVSNDKIDEEPANDKADVLNGDHQTDSKPTEKQTTNQPKKAETKTVQPTAAAAAPRRGPGRPSKQSLLTAKQATKAIVHEKIDFNKDMVPIRTYGKADQSGKSSETTSGSQVTTALTKRAAATKATVKPNTTAASPLAKLSPASRTIKKKFEPVSQGGRKGNLTISTPTKIEIHTSSTPVPPVISTTEGGGQKKVSLLF